MVDIFPNHNNTPTPTATVMTIVALKLAKRLMVFVPKSFAKPRASCTSCLSILIISMSSFLSADVKYEIHEIGTTQTHSSEAIAFNNKGQILGWYNVDGSKNGQHYFVKNKDGNFYELPKKENGTGSDINWKFLTDDGKAYGTFDGNTSYAVLYVWDQKNGVVKLGNLPGKEISGINTKGQVLIKSIKENEGGKTITRPVIWNNGKVTKLKGLDGDLGIPSEESYGFNMNNKGEVVGQSRVTVVYKNNEYKHYLHSTLWKDENNVDLHNSVPKSIESNAIAINDAGDIIVSIKTQASGTDSRYLLKKDGSSVKLQSNGVDRINNKG